jgi:hypothetical protein
VTGAAEKISNDEFSFSIMLGLSASLIQVSLILGCTIAAKYKMIAEKKGFAINNARLLSKRLHFIH